MAEMRVSLPGMFANIVAQLRYRNSDMADYYEFALDEVLTHLHETVDGKHTFAEFAEHYCLNEQTTEPPK